MYICIYIYIYLYMVTYPIFSKKYIDGSPLEIDTHRHFRTSNQISEPVRTFYRKLSYSFILYLLYIYMYIFIYG